MALTLPYEFDTSDVWRLILKAMSGLTLLITLALAYTLVSRQWTAAAPPALCSGMRTDNRHPIPASITRPRSYSSRTSR
ncbi:MAG: hypothetical protein ABI728_08325 [Betaproteobacteria bacterium]